MSARDIARRAAAHPVAGTALVALVLRVSIVFHGWATNPLVSRPQLDGDYYLRWAADIAAGDLAGTSGLTGGAPWVLNPLYAYVLAPFVGLFDEPVLPVLVFQAVLGAGTAAIAAAAAGRWFGARGSWAAGVLVAFAAPLAQLDQHVAVAEVSAFLVAGACLACAPPAEGRSRFGHGPVAAGLWLGVGAVARPITPLALPLVAWRFGREAGRPLLAAAAVAAAFAACAVPSLVRNWAVSGEAALYTVAGGVNLHLGNNPEARRFRTMSSPHFVFNPIEMHEDSRRYVHEAIGREPTRSEISDYWVRRTVDEIVRNPGDSALHYLSKARWFLGPVEVPSSASLATDVRFSPGLRAAFVPSWLVASLAVAGAIAWRRRRDLLLGPGALAAAHWAMLTIVFPLSHYRAPAIPALAILGAGAVVAAVDAWGAGSRRGAAVVVATAAAAAVAGAAPPGPDPLWFRDEAMLAVHARNQGDYAAAERHARAAQDAYRRYWGRDLALGYEMLGEMQFRQAKWSEAVASLTRCLDEDPTSPFARSMRSWAHQNLNDFAAAEADAREVIRRYPFLPDGHQRLAEVLSVLPGRAAEARAAMERAIERGGGSDAATMRRLGFGP